MNFIRILKAKDKKKRFSKTAKSVFCTRQFYFIFFISRKSFFNVADQFLTAGRTWIERRRKKKACSNIRLGLVLFSFLHLKREENLYFCSVAHTYTHTHNQIIYFNLNLCMNKLACVFSASYAIINITTEC